MKTTKADFEEFKKYCLEFQEKFSLTNYKIYFHQVTIKDAFADCSWEKEAAVAVIRLARSWSNERAKTSKEIKLLALHEILHLLLSEIDDVAYARFARSQEIDEAEHGIIRRLEHALGGLL